MHAQVECRETCAAPGGCVQPATVELEHYVLDDGVQVVTLGYCEQHADQAQARRSLGLPDFPQQEPQPRLQAA